jgi:hypothetical protein
MKIELAGQRVFSTGKIEGYTEGTLRARLTALGAHVAPAPNKTVTLALIGARASQKKIEQAQALGIPCVEGEHIVALLRDGSVEYEVAQATRSADELLGEARSLLARPLSHALWAELCALVDSVAPEQQDILIDYLDAQLARWPSPAIAADAPRYDERYGIFAEAAGELRYMPSGWLVEALSGAQHRKFTLCRALTFSFTKVTNTAALPVFDNPALAHLEVFDMGRVNSANVKKTNFYKAMASAKHLGHVKTLVVSEAPTGALNALHQATSLPSLRAIHLSTDTHYSQEPGKGAALFAAGPWAAQLKRVGVNHADHLERLVHDLGQLPNLTHIALNTHARTEPEDFAQMARWLAQLGAQIKRIDLAITSIDRYAQLDGYGVLLDAITGQLDVLDLSLSTPLAGESGVAFATKHLIQNGLGLRVGQLIARDRLSPQVCALLREAGVNVVADVPSALTSAHVEAEETAQTTRAALLDAPVTAPSGLSVADVAVFDEPCDEAWRVLISLVNGLERELEPARFEEAIAQLESYLTGWPDQLRLLPAQWWGALLAEQMNPKLRLVRAIWMDLLGADEDAKQTSNLISRLAQSKHLGHVTWLGFWLDGAQKHALEAVAALFAATRPESYAFVTKHDKLREAFKEHLRAAGLLPERSIDRPYKQRSHSSAEDALALRHAAFEVERPADLAALIQRTDLEHIIALDLRVRWSEEATRDVDWGAMRAAQAKLPALRYLALHTYDLPDPAKRLLATWLGAARPLFIDDPFSQMEPHDTPVLELMRAGLYTRTFGSYATLPSRMDAEQLQETLGSGAVQLAGLRVMYGGAQLPSTQELLKRMHPSLRERLLVLHWPLSPDEASDAQQLCAQLPALTRWNPQDDAFATSAGRAALITALAATHSALIKVQLSSPGVYKVEKLGAAELKQLDKGAGLDSKALSQRRLSHLSFI